MGTMTVDELAIQEIKAAKGRAALLALSQKHKALSEENAAVFDAIEEAFQLVSLGEQEPAIQQEIPAQASRPQQRHQASRAAPAPAPAVSLPVVGRPDFRPNGIAGLTGKEPVGAVLTIGHKGPRGNPEMTDRFFIVVPQMADGIRPAHPAFAAFNEAPPEKRQVIRGHLIHATRADMFEHNLKAQVLPKPHPAHPNKAPACSGDGERAVRWNGTEFKAIRCPNDLCEFRQKPQSGPTTCKPFMRILFRPRWAEVRSKDANGVIVNSENPLPTPLMKLTSGSWNNVRAFLGFFEYIEQQAKLLGVPDVSLYGLPFTITLSKKSIAAQQRAFPVLFITPDTDVQAFIAGQIRNRRDLILSAPPPVAALTDGTERSTEVEDADYQTINPGRGIPHQVATP